MPNIRDIYKKTAKEYAGKDRRTLTDKDKEIVSELERLGWLKICNNAKKFVGECK